MSSTSLTSVTEKYLKKRKRTKKLLCDVKEQVEFYFSDANLYRDKYLLQRVGPNGKEFVPISVLLSFNRLKAISATELLVQKAVRSIPSLQLSEDRKMVRRKSSAIQGPPANIDHCTIYVESIPLQATMQWMKELCRKLGPVHYISLPRYKSGSIKGFAFVEFVHVEDAILACSVINFPPKNFFPKLPLNSPSKTKSLISSDCTNEVGHGMNYQRIGDLSSSSNFVGDNISIDTSLDNISEVPFTCALPCNLNDTGISEKSNLLYNHKSDANHHPNREDATKILPTVNHTPTVKSKITCVKHSNNRKRTASLPLSIYSENEDGPSRKVLRQNIPKVKSEIVCVTAVKQNPLSSKQNQAKERTKRNRKRKHRIGTSRPSGNKQIKLNAIPKLEWLELKRSYLRQQRENFGKLKSVLQKWPTTDSETTSGYIKRHIALNDNVLEDTLGSDVDPSTFRKNSTERSSLHSAPVFVPGVIASLSSLTPESSSYSSRALVPLPSHDKIKCYFSQYGEVAYVDVKVGSAHGFIRFKDTSSAQIAIMEEKKFGLRLLTGVEEESYWDGLLLSRQQKRSRERRKTSGKEKLVLQAEHRTDLASKRHIKFNTDF